MSISSIRAGALAGLAFVGLVLSVNLVLGAAGQPHAGASASEVSNYYADAGAAVGYASAVAPLAWLCLPLFAAGVVAAVRRRSGALDTWSLVGLGGTIMQNALFAGVVACQIVLAAGGLSADVAWGVWQLHSALFVLNTASLATIMASLSVAGLRSGLIHRRHANLGLAASGVMAVAAVTTGSALDGSPIGMLGFAGFALWLVWLTTYGFVLLRESRATEVVPTEARVAVAA